MTADNPFHGEPPADATGGNAKSANFLRNTEAAPPHELLVEALAARHFDNSTALDLGCGAGRDSRFLLESGFTVTAVDKVAQAAEYLARLPHQDRLQFIASDFQSFEYGHYDVINAGFSLSFCPKEDFDEVMARVKGAVKPGGIFVAQFFGEHDTRNTPTTRMTFPTRPEAESLLRDMEIERLDEAEYDGKLANDAPNHWHLLSVVARKPQETPQG